RGQQGRGREGGQEQAGIAVRGAHGSHIGGPGGACSGPRMVPPAAAGAGPGSGLLLGPLALVLVLALPGLVLLVVLGRVLVVVLGLVAALSLWFVVVLRPGLGSEGVVALALGVVVVLRAVAPPVVGLAAAAGGRIGGPGARRVLGRGGAVLVVGTVGVEFDLHGGPDVEGQARGRRGGRLPPQGGVPEPQRAVG